MALEFKTFGKLTNSKLIGWYKLMSQDQNVSFIPKKTSWLMKLFAFFIGLARIFNKNICSPKEFIEDYTTTIYGNIYLSYEIGTGNNVSEIFLVLHELKHTQQFREHPILMPIKYLCSPSKRAEYEVECFMTYLETCSVLLVGTEAEKFVHYQNYANKCLIELQTNYGIDGDQLEGMKNQFQNYIAMLISGIPIPLTEPVRTGIQRLVDLNVITL
jgi:hypothetical protein